MEGIGSEVSQKIRAAIKAKLIELGAYVDDELPDYIMVMVANKRTKSQMDEDLQLFLTSNTKVFTSWLHTVLQKLQEVTVANFENKKDLEEKKTIKLKKSEINYNSKSKKSFEEGLGKLKKHGKKHKDSKKAKKAKHKSKEKTKIKSEKRDKSENKEKVEKREDSIKLDQNSETAKKIEAENISKKNHTLSDEPEKTMGEKLKEKKLPHQDKRNIFSHDSSAEISSTLCNKTKLEKETGSVIKPDIIEIKKSVIEDEFNIEPLKPNEKCIELEFQKEYLQKSPLHLEPTNAEVEVEKTISAPTEELLKEHNKIHNQKLEKEKNEQKKLKSDSEESMSPEEMRKQLLLSRAKKKLEHSKIADRMRSNSPDVLILEETNKLIMNKEKSFYSYSRFESVKQTDFQSKSPPFHSENLSKNSSIKKSPSQIRYSPSSSSSDVRKSPSPKKLTSTKTNEDEKSKSNKQKISNNEDVKITSSVKSDRKDEKRKTSDLSEKKKHVIKISENLETEKNTGLKKESNSWKDNSSRKKSVLSRVVTITGPEAPEISSIVKVKPREYISKDKQANKALILKAVAEAQKSIATVPSRPEPEKETKKEALFTKNLRQKHFEKLAITLSNIRKSPDNRERRFSADSEKSDKSKNNFDALEKAEADRSKSSKKMSKSEDQFISSKTTVYEKNDKYIRCWLEGVQKAVIDEEMINPQELEDLIIHSNFTDEDNEVVEEEISRGVECGKRKFENLEDTFPEKMSKNSKLSDKEIANLRVIPSSTAKDDGPQIVVTLDGLDTKTIKDIILRNKEARNGPILSSARKSIEKEKVTKDTQKISNFSKEKSALDSRKLGFQKISDRFARLNKSKEEADLERERDETRFSKYPSLDTGKEKKSKISTESKNRLLIAQLSEKFGKVDREFENKKRKYSERDKRCIYGSRKIEKEDIERNGKYKRSEKRSGRKDSLSPPSISSQFCKFYPKCKNLDCLYFHPKKCRFDEDCKNPDCKYVHSESYGRKSKWYSKS